MPFPLAHPVAVLPLKRYCPKHLNFAALVAGSIAPDLSYIFGPLGVSDVAHTMIGGLAFGVIAGLAMLGGFYAISPFVLAKAPEGLRCVLRPLCCPWDNRLGIVILSLAIGACSHVLLDSFTHTSGWFVQHLPALRAPLFPIHDRTIKVCHVMWYACSFIGVAVLFLALRNAQASEARPATHPVRKSHLFEAFVVAMLLVPIELFHHVVRSRLGLAMVAAASLVLVLFVLTKLAAPVRN